MLFIVQQSVDKLFNIFAAEKLTKKGLIKLFFFPYSFIYSNKITQDATQKFLEQIDVIHQIVAKYPGAIITQPFTIK